MLHCTWEQYAHSEPAIFLIRVCPRCQSYLDVKQYPQWEEALPPSQKCLWRASAVKQLAINFKSWLKTTSMGHILDTHSVFKWEVYPLMSVPTEDLTGTEQSNKYLNNFWGFENNSFCIFLTLQILSVIWSFFFFFSWANKQRKQNQRTLGRSPEVVLSWRQNMDWHNSKGQKTLECNPRDQIPCVNRR